MENHQLLTIETMETEARIDPDGICNKPINENWLEVIYCESQKTFDYKWDLQPISREKAIEILKTA